MTKLKKTTTSKHVTGEPKVFMTKEGLAELKTEYDQLINVRRKEVAERIKNAREFGDISENAEYESSREEQAFVEGRISELEDILNNVELMAKNTQKNEVALGCKVRLHIDGVEEEFQLVGAPEANPSEKKISHESPLGQALLGKKIGEKVNFEAPVGKLTYTVLAIV